jgi:hypothetical protein
MVTGLPQCGQLHVAVGCGAAVGLGVAFGVAGAAWRPLRRSQAAPQHFLEQ